jgi:hypothetical protein
MLSIKKIRYVFEHLFVDSLFFDRDDCMAVNTNGIIDSANDGHWFFISEL